MRFLDKRWLPLIGPILLLALWQLMISAHWVKAVLLPPPARTPLGEEEATGDDAAAAVVDRQLREIELLETSRS